MHQHRGLEVMLTLSKLRGEAATWYASDLGTTLWARWGGLPCSGVHRCIHNAINHSYLQIHARQALDMLRQAESDAKTYSKRFNAALARLTSVLDLAVLSQHDLAQKFYEG